MICSGERDWQIYFLFSGEIEVSIYCLHQRILIEQLYKGCSIGTYSCVSGIPIEMTALAKSHLIYYTISFSYIQDLFDTDDKLKENFEGIWKYVEANESPVLDFRLYYSKKHLQSFSRFGTIKKKVKNFQVRLERIQKALKTNLFVTDLLQLLVKSRNQRRA